jgi:hypothetical protein
MAASANSHWAEFFQRDGERPFLVSIPAVLWQLVSQGKYARSRRLLQHVIATQPANPARDKARRAIGIFDETLEQMIR